MRIMSLNANGIRAAHRKGLFDYLKQEAFDVVCLQETRAHTNQLTDAIFFPEDYHCYYHSAKRKGYSGVAIYSRYPIKQWDAKLGLDTADNEGRHLMADLGFIKIISLYMPSGSHNPNRQQLKYDFMDYYLKQLKQYQDDRVPYIICGDINIAHKQIDIKNWRGNQKNSGFLPEERAWMDEVLKLQYVDAFRQLNHEEYQYTWWSNRGQAWAKNVGWRIDYQLASSALAEYICNVSIYKHQRFSDHAPLIIEYNLP